MPPPPASRHATGTIGRPAPPSRRQPAGAIGVPLTRQLIAHHHQVLGLTLVDTSMRMSNGKTELGWQPSFPTGHEGVHDIASLPQPVREAGGPR